MLVRMRADEPRSSRVWGTGRSAQRFDQATGSGLLAQVELVEVEADRWPSRSTEHSALSSMINVSWCPGRYARRDRVWGSNCGAAAGRSSIPPRRPQQTHPTSVTRGRWRESSRPWLALLRERQRPPTPIPGVGVTPVGEGRRATTLSVGSSRRSWGAYNSANRRRAWPRDRRYYRSRGKAIPPLALRA